MVAYDGLHNPLCTGGLFHCDLLDESICHFCGVESILSILFNISWKILLANNVDPDQMPQGRGLLCLHMQVFR